MLYAWRSLLDKGDKPMATKRKEYLAQLHSMDRNDINQVAVKYLDHLLQHCTLHLVQQLIGISRTTLYKWLDEAVELDAMNHRDAAWLILVYETSPKVRMLLERGPVSNPRLAKRALEGEA